MDTYFQAVELYVIRQPNIVAFMGLSDEMVEMLFILPSEKGKGPGSSLLDFAITKKRIRKVDVNEQNTEAYQFYLRQGYKVTGKDYTDADGKPYPIIHLEAWSNKRDFNNTQPQESPIWRNMRED